VRIPAGGLKNALPLSGWLVSDRSVRRFPCCGVARNRNGIPTSVFIIGIDPHKASHTAAVIDRDERLVGEVSVRADRRQRERLLRWAAPFEPRLWAVEGATGHGALLAQQLVGAGETVVDVPAALSARARLLDSGHKDKTDAHDARSAAIVALRNRNLIGDEEQGVVLTDVSGRIRYWSAGAEHLFGYTADEVVGEMVDVIVPDESRDRHWAGFHRAMKTGECRISGATMNAPVQTRDDGVLAFPGRLLYLADARGNAAGALGLWARRRGDELPFTLADGT
jgi:PAS domain S-box-containing protein